MKKKYKYNKKADAALDAFYKECNAKTPSDKLVSLDQFLGGESNYSHRPTVEQKVAMLEYEYLDLKGLIKLILV